MEKEKIDIAVWDFINKVKADPDAFFAYLESKSTILPRSKEEMKVIKNHFKMMRKYGKLPVQHS